MKWVIRTKSPVPFLGDRQKMWGVPKIQEGTPLSLDVLFHGNSHKIKWMILGCPDDFFGHL